MIKQVIGVRFQKLGKAYNFLNTTILDLNMGDFLIVETTRGLQMGWVAKLRELTAEDNIEELKPILRRATASEMTSQEFYRRQEKQRLIEARMAAVEHNVRIKLVKADYAFDGSRLTFYYGSEQELDLSELENDLTQRYDSQVTFRQVGPRDVAKMMGGPGACGLPVRCCSSFLTEFKPISIRMAKAQDIALVPTEIAGMCGRLRCCLAYEYEFYRDAQRGVPKLGKWVVTEEASGKVVDRNLLVQTITLRTKTGARTIIPIEQLWVSKTGEAPAEGGSCGTDGDGCSSCSR